MDQMRANRRLRLTVSAIALLGLCVQPLPAGAYAKTDPVLDACSTERAPLVKLDTDYKELKHSKMSQAIGEGIKQGGLFLAKGVMSGNIPLPGSHSGGFGGGFGGLAAMSPLGAVAGLAAQQAAQQQAQQQAQQNGGAPPQQSAGVAFGQDMLSGAMNLNVPGIGGGGYGGDAKAYAALAVLVAIVATAEAYAQLKEQEAGGDLKKASYNIDQDAARQLAVTHEIADSGTALVECRSRQLNDINTRLAGASNDKDRKAIKRERTELQGALKKDIDLTGGVVDQHVGMAKTFTQGRAMTDGTSEADVLGGQTPAYATQANTSRLSMPKASGGGGGAGATQQAAAPAPPPSLVAIKAATVRAAPVASAAVLMNFPVGREVKPKSGQPDGGWWEVDLGGQSGYVRASELGPPGSAPVQVATAAPAPGKGGAKGKGGKGAAPPPPPVVAGPSNIRAYNQSVIAARDQGKGRLSSLMTDIQTSQKRESIFYAWLSQWGLG
ncbi:MAG: SH3 domain-containing protein [Caulobacterales bacterium]|nr:SH3 domain-containing protein [Caulobacterales bacterium]